MNKEKTGLQKLQQNQAFLRALIFALVTIIIWVGFSIFHTQQTSGIPQELQDLAIPINPNIDESVIKRIEAKRTFSPSELSNFPINRLVLKNGNEVVVRGNSPISDLNILNSPPASGSAAPSSTTPPSTVPPTQQPSATASGIPAAQ